MREVPLAKGSDIIVAVCLFGLFLLAGFLISPVEWAQTFMGQNYVFTALIFVALMFAATVVAPLSVLPLVPLAAPFLGPWQTALLAALGWTLGALAAFFIARRYGRPLLGRFVELRKLDAVEGLLPERGLFWWMLVLRMLVPVDVLSYALGLMKRVPFGSYALATALGVLPFSFIFAYSGDAFFKGQTGLLLSLAGLGLILFLVGWKLFRRNTR